MMTSVPRLQAVTVAAQTTHTTTSDWRQVLPVLTGSMVTLRELRLSDAPSLLAMLSTEEVARFISPPPTTVEGFERFIAWAHRERAAGNYVCYAVVPHGMDTAVGIFQMRQLDPTSETRSGVSRSLVGTGVPRARGWPWTSPETLGVYRLEAGRLSRTGAGTGAAVGAVKRCRRSLRHGEYHDQALWSIVRDDWRRRRAADLPAIHRHEHFGRRYPPPVSGGYFVAATDDHFGEPEGKGRTARCFSDGAKVHGSAGCPQLPA
jgi:RimJ/RimL family protein N-acetyltransferase